MLFLSRLSVKNGERLIRWQQECARTRPCWLPAMRAPAHRRPTAHAAQAQEGRRSSPYVPGPGTPWPLNGLQTPGPTAFRPQVRCSPVPAALRGCDKRR